MQGSWSDKVLILPHVVERVDEHIDRDSNGIYQTQPLAQDWARVAKVTEEAGEAIAELILMTGQSPRKGVHPEAREAMLEELADTAMAAVYAIQHFTKNLEETRDVMLRVQQRHMDRLLEANTLQ